MKRPDDLDVAGLTQVLEEKQACDDLRRYFGVGLAKKDLPPYTGGRFELFDGGGDRAETYARFTVSDIFAVQLLSVDIPAVIALDLIDGGLGDRAAELLEQIPTAIPLWLPEAEALVEPGGRAHKLWNLLQKQDGIGWVTAGKLLARKRPALIPVYDSVVRCAFGRPKDVWLALHKALVRDDGRFLDVLQDLIVRSEIPSEVTPLRALDVVLWMRHRSGHGGYRCPGMTKDATTWMSTLFEPEPQQWGLRGDPYLWRHMRRLLANQELSPSAEQASRLLYRTFNDLVNVDLVDVDLDRRPSESVHLEQYDHGGMSGGFISLVTWRDWLMPLLIERAEALLGT